MIFKENSKEQLKSEPNICKSTKIITKTSFPNRKKSLKKKTIKKSLNFYQQMIKQKVNPQSHVLNFYNILTINQKSIRNPHHDESFIKTYFYFKNLRKIEATDNYLIIYLSDNHSIPSNLSETITRYKNDPDERFQKIAHLLEEAERRVKFSKPESLRTPTYSADIINYLNKLGNVPYISKISSNKLVISKAMMEMFGYNSQDFIIQCLKFKIPLFEGFSCESYYTLILKCIQNVNLLMQFMEGRIPLCTFLQLNYHEYQQTLQSKNNIQYKCKMSLSMPMPLVSLVKVQKVYETKQTFVYENLMLHSRSFKQFSGQVRQKQYKILQYLTKLPENTLPQNRLKVADYIDRNITDDQISKSVYTQ